jgi:hypothetical protein
VTHAQREGGYLFLPGFFSLYDAIHGWMMGWIDGKLHEKRPRHPLLYVIGELVQVVEIIFELQKKKSIEKIAKRKISFPTHKICFFFSFYLNSSYFQSF